MLSLSFFFLTLSLSLTYAWSRHSARLLGAFDMAVTIDKTYYTIWHCVLPCIKYTQNTLALEKILFRFSSRVGFPRVSVEVNRSIARFLHAPARNAQARFATSLRDTRCTGKTSRHPKTVMSFGMWAVDSYWLRDTRSSRLQLVCSEMSRYTSRKLAIVPFVSSKYPVYDMCINRIGPRGSACLPREREALRRCEKNQKKKKKNR